MKGLLSYNMNVVDTPVENKNLPLSKIDFSWGMGVCVRVGGGGQFWWDLKK